MASILNTGISALQAFQRQLSTTGHNIANVNTEGYSRQRVTLDARDSFNHGGNGYLGTGVDATAVTRSYDTYLSERVRSYGASQAEYEIYHQRAGQVDNVVSDAAAGLDQIMQQFFASVQDVSADPSSIPARNVMINRSNMLVDRFQSINGWFDDLRQQANRDLESFSESINGLGNAIASLNLRIQESGLANPPNDLLDERDHLIDQLSQYVRVTTVAQSDSSTNVFIGNGQALVVGGNSNTLTVTNDPAATDRKEISINLAGGATLEITDQVTGGKLGGLLRFRTEVLDTAQNSLGLVALGLADSFNAEHVTGMDLNGNLGGNYFNLASPDVAAHPANSGSISVTFDDVGDVLNHDYELTYDGANWQLDDLTAGTSSVLSGAGPFVHDGMAIAVATAPSAGDTYRLRPARLGAFEISALVSDPRAIAAAEAVSVSEASANTGTAHVTSSGQVSSTGASLASLPITLTYNSGSNLFNVSTGGTIAYNPATDNGKALTLTVPGLGDFEFTVNGTPANGDQFSFGDNTGATGDNRNALRLAGLQSDKLLFAGTASLADAYGYMVADIGSRTNQASANASVQQQLLTQAESAKSAVSGVNLDEEAADMVRFQQAYSAAAQVIATANTLFDTLLGAVRR